jgi:two-component system OmpR family response regulator/two-component system response regulator CpxR
MPLMSEEPSGQVLLVEDDQSLCNLISHELGRVGLTVTSTDSSVDAIMKLQRNRYSVLLLDIMLSGSSGLYVVDALKDIPAHERPRVVVITGATGNILSIIDRTVVKAVFFKPLDVGSLSAYVNALARRKAVAHPDRGVFRID